jgi:phosphate transport system substrate-binding protein
MRGPVRAFAGWLVVSAVLAGCGGDGAEGATPGDVRAGGGRGGSVSLTGAGATFPYPIYSRWFAEYGREHPVRINYQSQGSGAGIRQITEGTVDFGASDAPMTEEELARRPDLLHVPSVLGAVTLAYNLPGFTGQLRLDGDAIAAIYLGQLTRWDDPRLVALNPGVQLPSTAILPVSRSDGSGTTYVFTDYLTTVSPAWSQAVGRGKSVRWPAGLAAKGNEGVSGQVRQSPGAIGYIELAYTEQANLPTAAVRNASGAFVAPSEDATSAAAADVDAQIAQNPDFRFSIVNAPGATAYPIASFTYLLIPSHIQDCARAGALIDVVRWSLTEGSAAAAALHYAPLPERMREQVLTTLERITCGPDRAPAARPATS